MTWDGASAYSSKRQAGINVQDGDQLALTTAGTRAEGVIESVDTLKFNTITPSQAPVGMSYTSVVSPTTRLLEAGVHYFSWSYQSAKSGTESDMVYFHPEMYVDGAWEAIYEFDVPDKGATATDTYFAIISDGVNYRLRQTSGGTGRDIYWVSVGV
jgi:hypothetical protein